MNQLGSVLLSRTCCTANGLIVTAINVLYIPQQKSVVGSSNITLNARATVTTVRLLVDALTRVMLSLIRKACLG